MNDYRQKEFTFVSEFVFKELTYKDLYLVKKKRKPQPRFYSVNFRNNRLFVVVVLPDIHFFINELNSVFKCDLSRFLPETVCSVFNGKKAIEKKTLFDFASDKELSLFPAFWKWTNSGLLNAIYHTDSKRDDFYSEPPNCTYKLLKRETQIEPYTEDPVKARFNAFLITY